MVSKTKAVHYFCEKYMHLRDEHSLKSVKSNNLEEDI